MISRLIRKLQHRLSCIGGWTENMEEKKYKAIIEGILFSIQSLMETMDFTMEEAMNALKIPKTEQEQYTKKLKQK